ncbi:MAG: ketoacyl-ACP synthase III [Actinomycetia bacterium]|nr:ketoacyl-ACP synthase III [Actinomycetes bacterium]
MATRKVTAAPPVMDGVSTPGMPAGVVAAGAAVPDDILTNAELERMVETSDEWIVKRTGIRERRIAPEGIAASHLGVRAARDALGKAGMKPVDLELIIVATVTGDMPAPSTACLLQEKIGAPHAACFDLSAGCTGFLYALSVAGHMVAYGNFSCAMVVGVEVLSRVTDWSDRGTCVLFGDGAGAVIVKPASPGSGILSVHLGSDGGAADLLKIPGGGSLHPASARTVEDGLHTLKMNGREIFTLAVRNMAESVTRALKDAGCTLDEVDCLIPHQANLRIIKSLCGRVGFPMEKTAVNIGEYGNTSSASIPLALVDAEERGMLVAGDLAVLASFGAGLTWGAMVLRWGETDGCTSGGTGDGESAIGED